VTVREGQKDSERRTIRERQSDSEGKVRVDSERRVRGIIPNISRESFCQIIASLTKKAVTVLIM